ncbi:MAG TPA: hypothetical protein VEQ58_16355, partial [Polyangiaceae bacterium]|nr:hypothetical protein [Polyangiaceae bacterium]
RRGVPAGAGVVVSDRGDSIAIAVTRDGKTTVRVYRDAARDCARRGHFVSVLVVVSLMPPDLGSDPVPAEPPAPDPPVPPPPPAPAPAPAPAPIARHVHVELGLRGEASTPISDSARVAAWGGALGVALGADDLRFTLGVGYTPRTTLRYTGDFAGSARLEQLDVALGVRVALGHGPLDTSFDAGLLLSRAAVTGLDSRRPAQDTAFGVGGRAGFHVGWSEASRVSPFLGAYAAVFPFAPALTELPQGTVGHLPYVWAGLSAGLALAL